MKKIVLSFVALFCAFSYVAFAQPNAGPAPVIAPEPLLNDMQLEREKWYYSLEEAMADPGKVYKLCLKGKDLQQVPKEVFYFTNLQVLNLSENKIKALPAELGHLKNLQVLNIYDNKVKMLPPEMQELTNITDLYLSQNRLIEVPAWIGGMGRLKNLDVSYNRIIKLEGERLQRALPKCKVTH